MRSGSILVVNAGSSSLKFSLFRLDAADALKLAVRGQIDGIGSRPHLKAKDEAGKSLVDRDLAPEAAREVKDAIAIAGDWLSTQFPGEPMRAVGLGAAVVYLLATIVLKLRFRRDLRRLLRRESASIALLRLLTRAPGNGAGIGGLKVVTEQGWFAARPSGTEDVYKLYAESFRGDEQLRRIQDEAQAILTKTFAAG